MDHTSQAIAIHHVRYGDNAAVAQIFTRESGYLPFMVRGLSSKKGSKRPLLQALSLVEVAYRENESREIQTLKSIRSAEITSAIQGDIVKSALALFLGEFLFRTMEQHYKNAAMFDYLWQAILQIEGAEFPANLHLKVLVDLTKFYGIQPQGEVGKGGVYLDMESGSYVDLKPSHPYFCSAEETRIIQLVGGMNFAEAQALGLSRMERNGLLDKLIEYYQLRYAGLNALNSRDILVTIFDA